METISLILLAGGKGRRMESHTPKAFLPLHGKPMALHSFDLFSSIDLIDEIVVVCPKSFHHHFPQNTLFALPGKERQDSVQNGFQKTKGEILLIHDSARPFVSRKDILKLIDEGISVGAATLGAPVKNTIKQLGTNHLVEKTPDRSTLFEVYTPQLLRRDIYEKGYQKAQGKIFTDDVSLAEHINHPVKLVIGERKNIKITTPLDLEFAACYEIQNDS
ncbi:MAG: 2-C-methyl-D-erythritol 4-phosphate cytidylyltransferase [Chlamydiia bacterium]|nr:2-C-methyl-D-erythritol 4-phosphate cytidylyltransferase [Chlamydiia bacterium]